MREATQPRYVLELGLVKLVEMRRVQPIEQILERLAKLESAFANAPIETEKKTLKTETPAKEFEFPAEEVPFPAKEVPSSKFQVPSSAELQITDYKLQSESEFESEITPEEIVFDQSHETQAQKNNEQRTTNNEQTTTDAISNLQSEEFLASILIKLPPITSEELEHIEDKTLDEAFERKLARLGDNLYPIKNVSKFVESALQTNAVKIETSSGNSAAAVAPARDVSAYIPNLEEDETAIELPALSENPTEEEMLAYAHAHPLVKKALRIFRGKITEVRKVEK